MLLRILSGFLLVVTTYGYATEAVKIAANSEGYVDAKVCGSCHVQQYEGFKEVGMSQSFGIAEPKWFTEDKLSALPFYHENSQRYYDIEIRGEDVVFVRYQLDARQQRINQVNIEIDYRLGSGNKTSSFLFRTENDELFLLPINWYSEGAFWEMSPGYEQKHHFGLSRKVNRECMFCHNAFPSEGMDDDDYWQRDKFPENLEHGIDCQRCHGPGEAHIKAVYATDASMDKIQSSIVNPAKLDTKARDSVCFQCHMLPAVGMAGVRRFERSDYSFRPGELLSDYMLHVDMEDQNMPRETRFEINHHGYRLSESQCFKQSAGKLTCISCHNPHQKPEAAVLYERVESTCLSCHQDNIAQTHTEEGTKGKECVACHMPQRRTQDVIHAVMTDHNIGVYQDLQKLTAPLSKQEPLFTDMWLYDEDLKLSRVEQDIYRLVTILTAVPSQQYADYLKSLLQNSNFAQARPYTILAEAQLQLKNYDEGLKTLMYIKQRFGSNIRIEELIATAFVASGKVVEALQAHQWLISVDDENANLYFNLGLLHFGQKKYAEAYEAFTQAVSLRENFANAILYQALSKFNLKDNEAAIQLFQRSLEIEPALDRSYVNLVTILHQQDQKTEAKRFYKLGLLNAIAVENVKSLSKEAEMQYLND